jgi:hypothetical protein
MAEEAAKVKAHQFELF